MCGLQVTYSNANGSSTLVERYNPCAVPLPTSCPVHFSDVPAGSTYSPISAASPAGASSQATPIGSFKPNNNVTRGQLSKIVSNAGGSTYPQPTQMFEDVPLGTTFQIYIGRLASRGYIGGYACGGLGEPCEPAR